jgi:peptide/nickel transport system permease protein
VVRADSFTAYAARRLLGVLAVVIITPALTFVVFGATEDDHTPWHRVLELPSYLHRTFVELDFGVTGPATQPETISHLVLSGLPVDLALLGGGLLLGVAAGMATGTLAGARRRGRADRVLALGSAAGLSVPIFWLGFVVIVFVSPESGKFQVPFVSGAGQYVGPFHDPVGWLHALWVPWVVLAVPLAAMVHRMVRATLPEALGGDHLRTARAKGLRERTVLLRHALPTALPPVLALVSVNVAMMLANVILIEPTFDLPGAFRRADVGQFLGEQSHNPSAAIVQALIVESALIIALTMLVCDLLHALLDPRVRA